MSIEYIVGNGMVELWNVRSTYALLCQSILEKQLKFIE